MNRRSSNTAQRAGLIAVAVALAAALAAAAARLGPLRRARAGAQEARPDPTYTCRCGTTYRVSGSDRHRVYWPADAAGDEPVLGDRCVNCDAPLPGGRATASA